MAIVTFLSDFGRKDSYVGAVHGRILSLAPQSRIVDITHDIPSFDIAAAAYQLSCCYHIFPVGTIHLAVVDPGVGSSRKAIVVKTADYFFVGPDNGLFSAITRYASCQVYEIRVEKFSAAQLNVPQISTTFHARDVFAPAAAFLAADKDINQIANITSEALQNLSLNPAIYKDHITAGILYVDHFGNIITALHQNDIANLGKRKIAEIRYKEYIFNDIKQIYQHGLPATPILLWGSSGYLEVAINQGSAAQFFNTDRKKDKLKIQLR